MNDISKKLSAELKSEKLLEDAKDIKDEMAKSYATSIAPEECQCLKDGDCDWCRAKEDYINGDVGC